MYDFLSADHIMLFDGGMGTMLARAGLASEGCPELLNITHPDAVGAVHRAYVAAGAEVVETNSLGANRIKLRKYGMEARAAELAEAAVYVAKNAVGANAHIAFSVGPTGDFLAPLGTLTYKDMYDAFFETCAVGARAGADMIFIETMMDLREARCALLSARDACNLPVCLSMTFAGAQRTLMGDAPECAAHVACRAGASLVGANCSGGPSDLLPVLVQMRAYSSLPVIIQPNAGLPHVEDGKTVFPLGAEQMRDQMRTVLDAGASAVGGCCGTTPEHIALLHAELAGRPVPARTGGDFLCSTRQIVPYTKDRPSFTFAADADPFDAVDELSMLDDGTPATLDLSAFSQDTIAAFVGAVSQSAHNPLSFRVYDASCAEATLEAYCGIAAISAIDETDLPQTAAHFGAYVE